MRSWAAIAVLFAGFAGAAPAQEHWVATWAASPQAYRTPPPPAPGAPARPAAGPPPVTSVAHQTVRMIVRSSIAGHRVRVQFSNEFGKSPLVLGAVHIARRSQGAEITPATDHALLFDGKASVSIPPGAVMLSDALDFDVPALGDMAISVYVPGESGPLTLHSTGLHTTYFSQPGDFSGQPKFEEAATSRSWYWVSSVDVLAPADAAAIVTFGDSITDGATSTVDADRSWPAALAKRLQSNSSTAKLAVINQGISGNRLLRDNAGVNALARFDQDVIAQPGVKWMTLLEGINDIGQATRENARREEGPVTADDIIGAMRQIIDRAHTFGIRVVGCTLTPYEGAAYYSESGEAIREAVNNWIRTSGAFDAVVDFDKVVRDPANPKQIRANFNERDHLHPNDAGYQAMAEAFDLALFTPRAVPASAARR